MLKDPNPTLRIFIEIKWVYKLDLYDCFILTIFLTELKVFWLFGFLIPSKQNPRT